MGKVYYISFYCEKDGELTGTLRQQVSVEVARDYKDQRSLNKILRIANKKAVQEFTSIFVSTRQQRCVAAKHASS